MRSLIIVLVTGYGTLVGVVLWFGLFYRNRVSRVPTGQLLTLILAMGLICRAAFSLLTPTFDAPDEHPHFDYVKYLAEHRTFPVSSTPTDEYFQPPLYYLALTPFYWLAHSISSRQGLIVRPLRAISIFLWCITLFFTFKIIQSLNIDDSFIKLFTVGMVSLLPTYTFLSSVINNDNLIVAIGSGILYLVVRPRPSLRNSALTGCLLGLGLLTKLTAVVFIPLIVLMLLIRSFKRRAARSLFLHIFLSLAVAAVIWAPWAWRTWKLYGSVTGFNAYVPVEWNSVVPAGWGELEKIGQSFWAVSGIYNKVKSFYPTVGKHIFYLAIFGLLYGCLVKREKLFLLARGNGGVIIAQAVAVVINLTIVLVVMYNQGQGRYLFPLLVPISLLMAIGLRVFSVTDSDDTRIHVAGLFITYAVSFTCFSLAVTTHAYE